MPEKADEKERDSGLQGKADDVRNLQEEDRAAREPGESAVVGRQVFSQATLLAQTPSCQAHLERHHQDTGSSPDGGRPNLEEIESDRDERQKGCPEGIGKDGQEVRELVGVGRVSVSQPTAECDNDAAEALASIAGTQTITDRVLLIAQTRLGLDIEVVLAAPELADVIPFKVAAEIIERKRAERGAK